MARRQRGNSELHRLGETVAVAVAVAVVDGETEGDGGDGEEFASVAQISSRMMFPKAKQSSSVVKRLGELSRKARKTLPYNIGRISLEEAD